MKKSTKIAIIVIAIIAIIAVVAIAIIMNSKDAKKENKDEGTKTEATSKLKISSAEDLENLVEKIYEENNELPRLMTQTIDLTDEAMVQMATGLDNGNDLEYLVVSEPLMTSQAYSLVLAKVKSGVDASKVAENMSNKVDMRKWICVSAEKLYATSSGDVVCLVMSSDEWAKPVYNKFKELAGTVGKEYSQAGEEMDFEPDMF